MLEEAVTGVVHLREEARARESNESLNETKDIENGCYKGDKRVCLFVQRRERAVYD